MAPQPRRSSRLRLIDTVRGCSVVSMVLFHLSYDLVTLRGHTLPLFHSPFEDVWRASIGWTFLFIAGMMCALSRDNYRRAGKYLVVAALIYGVTTIAAVDTPISFGIIFCMGASTLVAALLRSAGLLRGRRSWLCSIPLMALFLACLRVPQGLVGVGQFVLQLPRQLYATPYLAPLGFPGPHFASGDYYPLLPYSLLFLAGAGIGASLGAHGFPAFLHSVGLRPLEFVGRHALPIYVLHQPMLLLLSLFL